MEKSFVLSLILFVAATLACAAGEPVEIDVGNVPPGDTSLVFDTIPGTVTDYYIYSTSGSVLPAWSRVESIAVGGGMLTVGSARDPLAEPATAGAALNLDMPAATIRLQEYVHILNVVGSQGANGAATGTVLKFDALDMPLGGKLVIGDSAGDAGTSAANGVEVRRLAVGEYMGLGGIYIGRNSSFAVTGDGGTTITGFYVPQTHVSPFAVVLSEGSTLSVRDGLILKHGYIAGSGKIVDNVVLDSRFALKNGPEYATAEIIVAGGNAQEYGGDVIVGENGGRVSVAGDHAGAAVMRVAGTLKVDGSFAGSGVEVKGGSGGAGRLEAGALAATNGARIRASDGGVVVFKNAAELSGRSGIELSRGGAADFSGMRSGMRIADGYLSASGGGNVVVAGSAGLTAASAGAVRADGPDASLVVAKSAANPASDGRLAVAAPEALLLANGGQLRVGDLIVSAGVGAASSPAAVYSASASPNGAIAAGTFTVERGANAVDAAGVAMTVRGDSYIAGDYAVAGSNNAFQSGVLVEGSLSAAGTASVDLGASSDNTWLTLRGGRLVGDSGSLTLQNAVPASPGVVSVAGGGNGIAGRVDASSFMLDVAGDMELAAGSDFSVESYSQTSGTVRNASPSASAGISTVDSGKTAVVSGAGTVFAANARFAGGAEFRNGAVLAGADNTIDSTPGGGASLRIDASAALKLSDGCLTVRNLKAVEIDGVFSLGYNAAAAVDGANRLVLRDGVVAVFGDGARFELDDSFIAAYYLRDDFVSDPEANPASLDRIIEGRVAASKSFEDGWTLSNAYGDFSFKYSDDGLWIDSFRGNPVFKSAGIARLLRNQWGGGLITDSFAANVTAVARNRADSILNGGTSGTVGAYAQPGNFAGGLLYRMLSSLAGRQSAFSHTDGSGRTVSGVMDRGLVSALNGHGVYGPFMVARGVSLEAMSGIEAMLAEDRRAWARMRRDAGAGYAASLGGRQSGEFWAGVMGLWQDAGRRRGRDGYRYDGSGLQLGYDRASGSVRAGAAFTYMDGDYRDKSAASHASKISSYAFYLYGGYAVPEGYFATAALGYTDSGNRLRELRGGNWDRADYGIGTWHGTVAAGYDYAFDDRLVVTPSVGLAYLHSSSEAHNWYYGDVALLRHRGINSHVTRIPVELQAAYTMDVPRLGKAGLDVGLGYAYLPDGGEVAGTADLYGMTGVVPVRTGGRGSGRHEFSFGGGLSYRRDALELGIRYFYRRTDDFSSHKFSGAVGVSF